MRNRKRFLWLLPALVVLLVVIGGLAFGWHELNRDAVIDQTAIKARSSVNVKKTGSSKISDTNAQDFVKVQAKATQLQYQYGIGALIIPSVNIQLPVFSVMNDSTLSVGVARYFKNRQLGVGNNVYAAHNFMGADVLLKRISELKSGDKIYLSDFKHVYTYQVSYNRVVEMHEVSLLKQTTERRITLIRCEGPYHTHYRRVVVARMVATDRDRDIVQNSVTSVQKRVAPQWLLEIVAALSTGHVTMTLWIAIAVFWVALVLGLVMSARHKYVWPLSGR